MTNSQKLSEFEDPRPRQQTDLVEPKDELEQKVASIWQRVLGLHSVGCDENFFDLGGHSLAMVKVYDLLSDELKREAGMSELTLVEMFENPTVRALARHLRGEGKTGIAVGQMQGRALKQRQAQQAQQQYRPRRGQCDE